MADDAFLEVKREMLHGYAYVSGNGQLVLDVHLSDESHLLAAQTRDRQPLYDCRHYLKDFVPREWLGRQGTFMIDRTVTRSGEVVSVQLSFVPKTDR